jgi:hypothetical protein
MQMHQREEREGLGPRASGMLRKNEAQTLRLVAKLSADGGFRVGRKVALGEQ